MQENWKDVIIRIGRVLRELVSPLEEETIVAFERPSAPIAYQVPLSNLGGAEQLSESLLSTELNWSWQSVWDTQQRPLTLITAETVAEFISDWQEEVDEEGNGCLIFLIGHDGEAIKYLYTPSGLRKALERFMAPEEEPIRLVLVKWPDCMYCYLFVPHTPVEAVLYLLNVWQVVPKQEYPYSHLQSARLETIVDLLTANSDMMDG